MASFNTAIGEFTIIFIGWFLDPSTVSTYGACVRIALLLAFALQATNAVMNPLISELYHQNKHIELQKALSYAARIVLLIAASLFVVLACTGPLILAIFGSEYIAGYPILILLLITQIINAAAGSVGSIMKMSGHQNQACVILIITALLHANACVFLIPRFGIYGAAYASMGAISCWNAMMLFYIVRKHRLNPTALPWFTPKSL